MSRFKPYAEYFPNDDRLAVQLDDVPVARTKELDIWRSLDLSAENGPVAVEFTNVRKAGLILDDVPQRKLVGRLIGPLIAEFKLPVKRRTALEVAEREIARLRTAIQDALTVLGDVPCRQAIESCPGCAADIDEARKGLRAALEERQPGFELPPPLPAAVTMRLDEIRARRALSRRPASGS